MGIIIGCVAHEDVVYPTGSAYQYGPAIEQKGTMPLPVDCRINLPYAERHVVTGQRVSVSDEVE